jgi:Predicted pPIWI-associating nuclease
MNQNDIDRLRAKLTKPFHVALLDASLQSLRDTGNQLHATNFSNGFRELTRNVLDSLAPKTEIQASPWFKPDSNSRDGFTRRQRVQYVIHGGLLPGFAANELHIDVDDEAKTMLKALDELNKFVHVNEDTFDVDPDQLSDISEGAIAALADLLDCADACRRTLSEHLEGRVQMALLGEALKETIDDIDIIATHHTVEGIGVEEVEVVSVTGTKLTLAVTGYVEVELQWGSAGDLRRGEGAVMNDSFPVSCEFTSSVKTPDKFALTPGSLSVDNTSRFGADEEL